MPQDSTVPDDTIEPSPAPAPAVGAPFGSAVGESRGILELCVEYRARIDNVSYGHIPTGSLMRLLSSGRLCGVLLEHEVSELFAGLRPGSRQGDSEPDLMSSGLGRIQCKTYQAQADPLAVFKSGPRRGMPKIEDPKIWTTMSGYWDRRRRMSQADHAKAEAYFDDYDAFLYFDISRIAGGEYSFIAMSRDDVKRLKSGYFISEHAIRSVVKSTVDLRISG